IVCKSCHIPNCPTGITGEQGPYNGHPEHTKNYLLGVADEVRNLLSSLGVRHLREIVGRTDLLVKSPALKDRAALVDLKRFLHGRPRGNLEQHYPQRSLPTGRRDGEGRSLNERIWEAACDAIETCQNADLMFRIRNSDRSVGATTAGHIARLYGREGMPSN